MTGFERAPAIFGYTHPEGTDDGDDNLKISYKLIANSTVPTEDLVNERACSLLAPITGPLPFKLSINIIGQNDQTELVAEIREELMSNILGSIHEVLTEQATSVSLRSFIDSSDGKNAVNLFFDPIKRPLSDSMTRQPVARMASLNLHISIDHGHDTKITKSTLPGLLDSMDSLVIHVLVSYLSQEIPLLFNSEYREWVNGQIPYHKITAHHVVAIAGRSESDELTERVDKMPIVHDLSLDIVHREQTRGDRVAGQLLKILLHHDYEQLIESTSRSMSRFFS
ncbi:hypothetical protein Pst134EA_009611 [Puccinia striiformis f. sp. tritici]|uniref:hypothetical protein n=1 Tax=Puccinia striiformis f. sp. tritici TaxID=168172 RepID=UPI002008B382|nr:hypothetical protein Pst134EA_009611 [Puccinia striiformis f. sp. tritici]KAH9469088.1 hypothetical protein Pst134EA_009611 [Puccinia striiformis f. sp. tritici]